LASVENFVLLAPTRARRRRNGRSPLAAALRARLLPQIVMEFAGKGSLSSVLDKEVRRHLAPEKKQPDQLSLNGKKKKKKITLFRFCSLAACIQTA
jgi:hypothetical protein